MLRELVLDLKVFCGPDGQTGGSRDANVNPLQVSLKHNSSKAFMPQDSLVLQSALLQKGAAAAVDDNWPCAGLCL